ncbi:SDR family NAD(P)-dependent oxidoreductase [Enterobacillus tribolii]|uniref:NAD(P)-dependent dehydrogenase (Short-subunit alcohol dehydrogenase family) n=1 Tax=Enterobacillus tribolii TaxID=1487935 RepID=A0A370QNX6_9GAMM|nr:SDR family oxidoreductase [Enterobacillus tribolii]MBW7981939.1 SDR family oxidoreductase [Enterobacillus tribolii]RDK90042.1 NAD(P)-dependent dehydrogenase (short-subunit alcohol dehydrogenase family) [Enterobacillus tribolii]
MTTTFTGRQAFITGASSGIGKALVSAFLATGYQVDGIDCAPSAFMAETRYRHHQADVTEFTALDAIFEQAEYGSENNLLINCAGTREICPVSELSLSLWERVFAVNVTASFIAGRAFCQQLVRHGVPGNVINIASVSGMMGEPNRTAYVASKHAVLGLTKQLAIEFGAQEIRVNAIAPGVIRTPLTEPYYHDPNQLNKIKRGQFIPQLGEPEDVAEAALYLSSPKARFITGSTLVMDGGWTIGKDL